MSTYNNQVFGHQEIKCGRHPVCCNWAQPEHCASGQCDKPVKCVNCSGDHPVNSKQCPLESPYHLAAVSGALFTQGMILIVILVSSGSAKSRTHQSAVGGFLVTRRGWPGRLRACRIWTFINSVWLNTSLWPLWRGRLRRKHGSVFLIGFVMLSPRILKM